MSATRQHGDDAYSASSSMGESAYVSLPDGHGSASERMFSQSFHYPQGFVCTSGHGVMQRICSSAASTVSYMPHSESGSYVIPVSAAAKDAGSFEDSALPDPTGMWPVQAPALLDSRVVPYSQAGSPILLQGEAVVSSAPYARGRRSHFTHAQSEHAVAVEQLFATRKTHGRTHRSNPSQTSSHAEAARYVAVTRGEDHAQLPYSGSGYLAPEEVTVLPGLPNDAVIVSYVGSSSTTSPTSPLLDHEQTESEWSKYLNIESYELSRPEEVDEADGLNRSGPEEVSETIKATHRGEDLKLIDQGRDKRALGDDNARSDPLYLQAPDQHGNYHCPFLRDEDCGHGPTRLKCNYDKYIDSHLRPFRCHVLECADKPFSSTACLLRHQREAHAMHGHGNKPHVCMWLDCDRSKPGNGFPRRYNLLDHMKRVHNYSEPLDDEPPSHAAGARRGATSTSSRKRVSSNAAGHVKNLKTSHRKASRKTAAAKAEQEAAATAAREKKARDMARLKDHWMRRRMSLQQRLDACAGPEDDESLERIRQDFNAMEKIRARFDGSG